MIGSDESVIRVTRPQRILQSAVAHPLICVALLGVALGAANIFWIAVHRGPGGLDVDEVSYLTEAFRWNREIDPGHPFAVPIRVFTQDKGPVTMLVSSAALLFGPRTVTTAFVASVIFYVLSAVAVAGIARRLAGPYVGIVAGTVALTVPTAIAASRSYQLAPATAAWLAVSVWCLVASERGTRVRQMLAFGLSVGLLLLSRTMAVALIPGLTVGALLYMDRTKRRLRNTALAGIVAAIVAGPWWWAQRESIMDYLMGHGYGDAAGRYGPDGIWDRFFARVAQTTSAILVPYVLIALAVVGLAGVGFWHFRQRTRSPRALMAVWLAVGIGFIVLMTTSNQGMYFELPLIVVGVAGIAGLAPLLPRATRTPIAVVVLVVAALTFILSMGDHGGSPSPSPISTVRRGMYMGLASYQATTIDAEPDLGAEDVEVRRKAMERWWEPNLSILTALQSADPSGQAMQTVCGSGPQLNAGTLTLASELSAQRRDASTEWLSTSAPVPEMESRLEPTDGDRERIVVLIELTSKPFPNEDTPARCLRIVEELGWKPFRAFVLPDGGTAVVYTHPSTR